MIRFLGIIRRRPDLTYDAFTHHWGTTHRDLVLEFSTPGPVSGYVQNRRLSDAGSNLVSDYDGVPELWIRDWAGLAELGASERFQYAVEEDSKLFIDVPPTSFLVRRAFERGHCRANVVDRVKLMLFWHGAGSDGAGKALEAGWELRPEPLLMPGTKPLRLERDVSIAPPGSEVEASDYVGIESSWWPDETSLSKAWEARSLSAGPIPSAVVIVREDVACTPPDFDMTVI